MQLYSNSFRFDIFIARYLEGQFLSPDTVYNKSYNSHIPKLRRNTLRV